MKNCAKLKRNEDKIVLRDVENRLKEIRKMKNDAVREKKIKKVETSKTMTEFWAAIRVYRPGRKRRVKNI